MSEFTLLGLLTVGCAIESLVSLALFLYFHWWRWHPEE